MWYNFQWLRPQLDESLGCHSELIETIWRKTKQREMCEILFFFEKHSVERVCHDSLRQNAFYDKKRC